MHGLRERPRAHDRGDAERAEDHARDPGASPHDDDGGAQLLPPRPLEAWRLRFERLNPVLLASALALVILFVGATVPSQGVAPFIYFRF